MLVESRELSVGLLYVDSTRCEKVVKVEAEFCKSCVLVQFLLRTFGVPLCVECNDVLDASEYCDDDVFDGLVNSSSQQSVTVVSPIRSV